MRLQRCIGAIVLLFSAIPTIHAADALQRGGRNVVLWISVDGFRGDYVDRGKSPFLESLMAHGQFSREMMPVFPSLTFPSHVSEVTGVLPGVHGIISNKYLDTTTGELFNLSTQPQALRAEPIWFTATRQGVRTAALDWPLSGGQDRLPDGTLRSAYFNAEFDPDLTDRERLGQLVTRYRGDFDTAAAKQPLQLLMGYACGVDKAGHKVGPHSAAVDVAVAEMDQLLFEIVGQVAKTFDERMSSAEGDALWVLITTDHGMSTVEQVVNVDHLMGDDAVPEAVFSATSGGLANVYLNRVPASQREAVKEQILANVRKFPFAGVWKREDLPAKWSYDAPGRTGDLVISLDKGYTFGWREGLTIAPVADDIKFPRGMHSYDPVEDAEMRGVFVLARWGSKSAARDLGPFDSLRIHPTVAKLLNIQPAEGARGEPLEISDE